MTHSVPTRRSSDRHPSTGGDRRTVVRRRAADHHGVSGVVDLAFVEPDRADHRVAIRRGKGLERALPAQVPHVLWRSEEHTSELQSLMRTSYAVLCLTQKYIHTINTNTNTTS